MLCNCRSIVYGLNEINVPLQSIGTLVLLEILNPIYFFQVFSLIVWFCESYYYYTIAIIIMSFYGITSNVIQTYRVNLRKYFTLFVFTIFFM